MNTKLGLLCLRPSLNGWNVKHIRGYNSHFPCITDRVTLSTVYQNMLLNNSQSGAKKCNRSEPVLHRFYPVSIVVIMLLTEWPSQQWALIDVLLTGWSCQQWLLCLIDRVTLSAVGGDVLLTGSPSGWWCLIDKVTLSALGVDVSLTMLTGVGVDALLTGSPCQQWVFMS